VDAQNTLYFIKVKQNSCTKARFSLKMEAFIPSMGRMRFQLISACVLSMLMVSCLQMNQNAVGPIPPPAPETLCRPIPEAHVQYYTLPAPVEN
jgi:hypothetical protein